MFYYFYRNVWFCIKSDFPRTFFIDNITLNNEYDLYICIPRAIAFQINSKSQTLRQFSNVFKGLSVTEFNSNWLNYFFVRTEPNVERCEIVDSKTRALVERRHKTLEEKKAYSSFGKHTTLQRRCRTVGIIGPLHSKTQNKTF